VKVGDIVLRRMRQQLGKQKNMRGWIIKVLEGTSGIVQSADVEYRLTGEEKFRKPCTRLIHKLIMVVPSRSRQ
jgi:hypothetical protein